MITIYILTLEYDKYYVGRTNNVAIRMNKHFNNTGSYWTIKYKPIHILEIYENCDEFDEDKYTIKMMAKYGMDNVRGGSFTKINLTQTEKDIITKMINTAYANCFNCHFENHFANECPYDKIKNDDMIKLRDNIIRTCREYNSHSEYIQIQQLLKILSYVDDIIFNEMTRERIKRLCKIMNNNTKNIGLINTQYGINYVYFSIGISVLLDNIT